MNGYNCHNNQIYSNNFIKAFPILKSLYTQEAFINSYKLLLRDLQYWEINESGVNNKIPCQENRSLQQSPV